MKIFVMALWVVSLVSVNQAVAIERYFPNIKAEFSENIDLYCVEKGDSIISLALKHKVSPSFLLYLNEELHKHESFYVGKTIKLPGDNIKSFIESRSKSLNYLINQLGADDYQNRRHALNQLINKDWLAVPILLKNVKHKDVEIRGNVKDALKQIFNSRITLPLVLSYSVF